MKQHNERTKENEMEKNEAQNNVLTVSGGREKTNGQ